MEITEKDVTFTLRAEVPGFEADELDLIMEPRRSILGQWRSPKVKSGLMRPPN
jgi:HSP20 family molecular chaperone IbpA